MQLSERAWHTAGWQHSRKPSGQQLGHLPILCKQTHVMEEIVGVVVTGKACKAFCSRRQKSVLWGDAVAEFKTHFWSIEGSAGCQWAERGGFKGRSLNRGKCGDTRGAAACLFSTCVSASGISAGCDVEVTASHGYGGRPGKQQLPHGDHGEHLGINWGSRGGYLIVTVWGRDCRALELVLWREGDIASSGMEKAGCEGSITYVKAPALVGMNQGNGRNFETEGN